MNFYKITMACFGASFLLLQSCSKEEQGFHQDKEDQQGAVDALPLKLTLQLKATVKPAGEADGEHDLWCEFSGKKSAVALIRCSSEKEVMVLPCVMNVSKSSSQVLEISDWIIPVEKIKASPTGKWEMKLLVGGEWDEESGRLSFQPTTECKVTDKLSAVDLNQPYATKWTVIPTDEKGYFKTDENEKTVMELDLHQQGMVIAHHIASCKAPFSLQIEKMKIDSEAMALGGFYDLSDKEALKGLSEETPLVWNLFDAGQQEENELLGARECELELKPAYVMEANVSESRAFVYLWAMPLKQTSAKLAVHVKGHAAGDKGTPFNQKVFEEEVAFAPGTMLGIRSAIEIEESENVTGPIVLKTKDGRTELVADGQDVLEFVIEQSGVDVTEKGKIYQDRGDIFGADEVKGNRFSTNRTGTYRFFAEKDGQRSDVVEIIAKHKDEVDENGNILNGLLFCKNVTPSSGWYDVNKVGNGMVNGDGLLCWAAASSNMLQWWLEDFKNKGNVLPDKVPFGKGSKYDLKIFDTFYDSWENGMHATDYGIRWFMEGGGDRWTISGGPRPNKPGWVVDGGFFRGVLPAEKEKTFFESEYVRDYGAYSNWEFVNGKLNPDMHRDFSRLVIKLLSNGISALSIDSHELTLWGCEVKDGLVVKVYITNSDDGGYSLATFSVSAHDTSVHLDNYPGKTNRPTQVIRLTGLKAYSL